MRGLTRTGLTRTGLTRTATIACTALCLSVIGPTPGAFAVELIKDLKCALRQTTHSEAGHCLKIFNTCNTPIVSRIEEQGGVRKDSPEVRSGERGKICSSVPFAFLGNYITGPLAQGAGD